MSPLSKDAYEDRKRFLTDLKTLAKSEKEQLFRILKTTGTPYSENSNGIFFDVVALPDDIFVRLSHFVAYCKEKAKEQEERLQEMNTLRNDLSDDRELEGLDATVGSLNQKHHL